jgi:glycosyltransferase involved in cell wall biosynthesis
MTQKIKILHIIKSLGRGGAEMLLPETLKLHNKTKFEFHYIYFLPWKNQMVESIEQHGGKVTCIRASNNIQLILNVGKVVHYIRDRGIQVIHSHLPWAGIVARIAGKISNVPVVYTEHNKQERYHFATRILNLATMNWSTRIIAVSEDVAQSIRMHKSTLTVSIQTILNGVNLSHFAAGAYDGKIVRDELNIPHDAPLVGTIAVFRFQKRLDLWMELAKKIMEQLPQVHFIIVGDGPLKESLFEKRSQLHLEDRVHMVGLKTEIRPYLAAFDIYMMSSIFEGLPIALLEAMAYGCPVISTDAGGIKEVIRDDRDGLLCSVNQPERLVQFALQLLGDTQKSSSLRHQSRRRMEEKFSMNVMVEQIEKAYRSILDSSRIEKRNDH